MIKPTTGRVVWYYPNGDPNEEPYASLITYVHSDKHVNLATFNYRGELEPQLSVYLAGDGEAVPTPFASWMPYQVGQAAKTEAAEKALAEKK